MKAIEEIGFGVLVILGGLKIADFIEKKINDRGVLKELDEMIPAEEKWRDLNVDDAIEIIRSSLDKIDISLTENLSKKTRERLVEIKKKLNQLYVLYRFKKFDHYSQGKNLSRTEIQELIDLINV